jgi:RecB family endonuclease NucS
MPLKITPIDLTEQELEDLLFSAADLIEPDMKMLSRQHPTDSGPLDLLGFDEDGTLVVCELKVQPTDSHLDQGMRYYDWCRQNIAWLHKSFPKIKPENPPRLILIAPSFTSTVKRIAKYVQVELQLLDYQAIQDANGEKGLICREVEFGLPPDPPPVPSFERILE